MMRINGVCELDETCEYEANKIHIRLDSLRSEIKKRLRIRRTLQVSHRVKAQILNSMFTLYSFFLYINMHEATHRPQIPASLKVF
jgi:hypothetical protein